MHEHPVVVTMACKEYLDKATSRASGIPPLLKLFEPPKGMAAKFAESAVETAHETVLDIGGRFLWKQHCDLFVQEPLLADLQSGFEC